MALTRGMRLHQYLDDWLIRAQSQKEAQVNTQTVVDLTQSLVWIINQEKSELKPTQVFSSVGYELLLASTEKMVPEGHLHMRPFQFHLKGHWRYPQSLDSLLPWTETISAHLEWWQNPTNVMKGTGPHPKDHSTQLFTDSPNERWGAHLEQVFTKGLWSDREKRLYINVLEL